MPQCQFQEWCGAGFLRSDDFLGRALGDDLAAGVAGFGADVEDPVGFGGNGHVVLDDDDGVAFIDEDLSWDVRNFLALTKEVPPRSK